MRPDAPSIVPGPPVAVHNLLTVPELAGELRVVAGDEGLDRPLTHPRMQKSGLGLAGYLPGIVATRVQILGETELGYFAALPADVRNANLDALFSLSLSCVVVTRGIGVPDEILRVGDRTGTPILLAQTRSSSCIALLHTALDRLLAPRQALHGVMVEVHGVGILLTGPSGIGKSECALFLVERGHRLVADDRVELMRLPGDIIHGAPAPLLKHHLEIRGLGILNIRDLFGATAVREEARLDLVIDLVRADDPREVDRLGLDQETRDVLGVEIPLARIPVHPGRDMGVLLEVAARNHLLKSSGNDAARRFVERLARGTGSAEP